MLMALVTLEIITVIKSSELQLHVLLQAPQTKGWPTPDIKHAPGLSAQAQAADLKWIRIPVGWIQSGRLLGKLERNMWELLNFYLSQLEIYLSIFFKRPLIETVPLYFKSRRVLKGWSPWEEKHCGLVFRIMFQNLESILSDFRNDNPKVQTSWRTVLPLF